MGKKLVALGLAGMLLFATPTNAFPIAIPVIFSEAVVCLTKKAITLLAEEKLIDFAVSKIQNEVNQLAYSIILEGKFLSDTGYEKNIKGILGEEIAKIFLERKGYTIISKHINESGIDIIACSRSEVLAIEVKFGKSTLSTKQRQYNYAEESLFKKKDKVLFYCPYFKGGKIDKLLFKVSYLKKGIYRIDICKLQKYSWCYPVRVKLYANDIKRIKKSIYKEVLKVYLRKKFGLSREEISKIVSLIKNEENLEDWKNLVKELKNLKYFRYIIQFLKWGC